MKFKHLYKCQRCGEVFEGRAVHELATACPFTTGKHEHICALSERGIGIPIGYKVIDEVAETPPAGESQPAGKKAASTVSIVMYQDASRDAYIDRVFRSRSSAEEYVAVKFGPEARAWIEDCVVHD